MNWMRGAAGLGVVAGVLLSSGVARADDELPALPAPEVQTAPAPVPKDVVRLKNGGIVRGTIIELEPDKRVTIQLATGETRTFRWTETTYAGPEGDAPSDDDSAEKSRSATPRVEKRVRSSGALVGGIVSVVASQISVGIAMFAWLDQLRCESDRRQDEFMAENRFPGASFPTRSCSNTGTIAAGIVGGIVLLGVGVPLIVYGAKRVPVEKPNALRFVPWNQGTTAAGGSLQLRF